MRALVVYSALLFQGQTWVAYVQGIFADRKSKESRRILQPKLTKN